MNASIRAGLCNILSGSGSGLGCLDYVQLGTEELYGANTLGLSETICADFPEQKRIPSLYIPAEGIGPRRVGQSVV